MAKSKVRKKKKAAAGKGKAAPRIGKSARPKRAGVKRPKARRPAGAKPAGRPKAAGRAKPSPAPARSASTTPQFRAYLSMSLDGYIADKNGGVDWLNAYLTPEIDFDGFMRGIGATVMGRVTYDWAVAHGMAGGGRTIVLTHRRIENAPAGVESFDGDVRELAARLRAELAGSGKDIWLMGGGQSLVPFLDAGLVDRLELGIVPVLLGDGIPLFPRRSQAVQKLRMVHSRALSNGIVEVQYEVLRAGG